MEKSKIGYHMGILNYCTRPGLQESGLKLKDMVRFVFNDCLFRDKGCEKNFLLTSISAKNVAKR
jgi:hypothetical protein